MWTTAAILTEPGWPVTLAAKLRRAAAAARSAAAGLALSGSDSRADLPVVPQPRLTLGSPTKLFSGRSVARRHVAARHSAM